MRPQNMRSQHFQIAQYLINHAVNFNEKRDSVQFVFQKIQIIID